MNKIKTLFIAIAIGLCATFLLSGQADADSLQEDIATKIIRFHVLANSDSEEDQALKLKVKEAVINYISPYFEGNLELEDTKKILNDHNEEIIDIANKVISQNGYDYIATTSITKCYFPIKSYGDVTLPAGDYEAFRIEIGNASGKNWWCILYPPLCFVDVTYGIVPDSSKQLLQNILDEDEYDAITASSEDNVEYGFKFLTFLNDLFQ